MKRYQCIKTYYVTQMIEAGRTTVAGFKAGRVYPECFNMDTGNTELVDDLGTAHVISPGLLNYFQELLDLNVDDHEEEQYTTRAPSKMAMGTGCAIIVAAILTIFITLLSMI